MNLSIKDKLLFSLFTGLSFAILNSLANYFLLDRVFSWGLFAFNLIFFGFSFGFLFLWFAKKQSGKLMKKIQIQLNDQEEVRFEGPANLFRGIEGVGGKLLLTDQRLVFRSHKFNVQTGETQLFLSDIQEAIPRKTAKLFQNGMRIISKAGEQFDFVVYEREHWLAEIKSRQTNG